MELSYTKRRPSQYPDEEILLTMNSFASVGILSEPAAASALAGTIKARLDKEISSSESVVMINTGTGLKDTSSIKKMIANNSRIDKMIRRTEASV